MYLWLTIILIFIQFLTSCNPEGLISKYPFVVVIEIGGEPGNLCSGSLLDLRWVLTSAKLVYKYTKIPDTLIVARLNQTRIVEKIHHHPEYNPNTLEHDLALVSLKHPFDQTASLEPIRIPSFPMDIEMFLKSEEVELTRIQGATMEISRYRVLTNKECAEKVSFDLLRVSFCAEPIKEKECLSNSGVPAVLEDFVFGVSSFGCSPEVFTRVDKHLQFISKTMDPNFTARSVVEGMKRESVHFIIAVSFSVLTLIIVLLILLWTVGISEKLKCWKRTR